MGVYLNPGSKGFRESIQSKIYVDKTGLIEHTNAVIDTRQKYICVSRPRRFGKSMAADMLAAYYGCEDDTRELFAPFEISHMPSYNKHRNRYYVIKINMQEFLSRTHDIGNMLALLQRRVVAELKRKFPEVVKEDDLIFAMQDIYEETRQSFIILIDEWDCLFREYQQNHEAQKQYLDFLRAWLKDQEYVGLAYMTGILPVKKYGSHSALNMFTEYSMTNPREMAVYFGFTEQEVRQLALEYHRNFEETKAWYDGYEMVMVEDNMEKIYSLYSPKSVVEAMLSGVFDNYWNQTESYEALRTYIRLNYDGLKDAVIQMLAGESVSVNTGTFSNDMTTFVSKDDVLTLLVHLGYLSYHRMDRKVSIPNKEVAQEYVNAIAATGWGEVMQSVNDSEKLLQALWRMDADAVAEGVDRAHDEIAILQYNDENSLSCTIGLAFYAAREYYTIVREFPAGKGYADICMIPRKLHADKPAIIIELKYGKSAEQAICQIKERRYEKSLRNYRGNLLLAGINYDRKSKKHSCIIERAAPVCGKINE